jgi:AcrR family transcriptional regulator
LKQGSASNAGRRRAGRPSREDAERLGERILTAATELLLNQGYGATSVEAIARRAHISKRTFYHRFSGKKELTMAVIVRLIDSVRPPAEIPLIEGKSLLDILVHLGSLILEAALTPRMLALHRLIVAESNRFPDMAAAVVKAGGREEAVVFISGLLRRHGGDAAVGSKELRFAAEQLLQMIVSTPQSRAMGQGVPMDRAELDAWVLDVVNLFLDGFNNLSRPSQSAPENYGR